MKHPFILFIFVFAHFITAQSQNINSFNAYLTNTNQVLFVKTRAVDSVKGMMFLYERKSNKAAWKIDDSFAVVVGKNGLGGDSNSPIPLPDLLMKKEGDGKSPAGIFPLGVVFSYHDLKHIKMPFKQVDTLCHCVDDTASSYYNTLIVADTAKQRYNSFEYMKRRDDFYEYGIWVSYNSHPVVAGNGSCIFIHVWKDENSGTSGCTAMSKQNIMKLVYWLKQNKHPVMLQVVKDDK